MPIQLNIIQRSPAAAKHVQSFLDETQNSINRFTALAFANSAKKVAEQQKSQKEKANEKAKKSGSVSLSNTDSVSKCQRLKGLLSAKLSEIYASGAEDEVKEALAREIMMQIQRVETKIVEIQRRERALAEEKSSVRKKESKYQKRRRKQDMEKRTTLIKREYLYPADEGGLDPNAFGNFNPAASASGIGVIAGIGGGEVSLGDADVSMAAGSIAGGGLTASGGAVSAGAVSFEASV